MTQLLIALVFSFNAFSANELITQREGDDLKIKTETLKVPNNQATYLGRNAALVETGNPNLLANPGFEHETITSGWVLSCTDDAVGIATPDSDAGRPSHFGKKTLNLEINGMDTGGTCVFYQDVATGGAFDYMHSIWAKADKEGKAKALFRKNEAFVTGEGNELDISLDWNQYKFQRVSGSTHAGIGIEVTVGVGETVNVALDEGFVGVHDPVVEIDEMTDWESFTPVSTTWTSNITWYGLWRRVGSDIEVQVVGDVTGTPAVSGEMFFDLPGGLEMDDSKITPLTPIGQALFRDVSAVANVSGIVYSLSGFIAVRSSSSTDTNGFAHTAGSLNTNTLPFAWAAGDFIRFNFKVPIKGWTSKFKAITAVTEDPNTIGHIEWASMNPNAPEGYISAMGKTIGKTSGDFTGNAYWALYNVLWNLDGLGTNQSSKGFNLSAAKGVSAQADWDAGKTIKIDLSGLFPRTLGGNSGLAGAYQADEFKSHSHTAQVGNGTANNNYFSNYAANNTSSLGTANTNATGGTETRPMNVAGHTYIRYKAESKVIIGSFKEFDYVYVEATSDNSSQTVGSTFAVYIYEDEVKDNTNSYNHLTGVFTVPVSGIYEYCHSTYQSVNLALTERITGAIFVDGVQKRVLGRSNGSGAAQGHLVQGCILLNLDKGQEVTSRFTSNVTTTATPSADNTFLTITRIPGQFP